MKIQCSSCEVAEANVFCCADEAALCRGCDVKIHAANKLASKHQRVPLSASSSPMPNCDICQETVAYFFCLEDRALLCRKCDVAIHVANSYVSGHQRFLLTGVKVGLGEAKPVRSSNEEKLNFAEKVALPRSMSRWGGAVPITGRTSAMPGHVGGVGNSFSTIVPFACGTAPESVPERQLDEFLGLIEFDQDSEAIQNGSYKADGKGIGDSEWSQILRTTEEELFNDDWSRQASDEMSWTVPQNSPPRASSLYFPRNMRKTLANATGFLPDS